jgi:dihydroorotate dehydrogenase (NAD+) catalytic subunit
VKARRRVVTAAGAAARPKRTPTVRRIKPAIVPVDRSRVAAAARRALGEGAGGAGDAAAGGVGRPGAGDLGEPVLELPVDLGRGLVLRNPLVGAAGAFGYGVEVGEGPEIERLGALVTRSTTLHPRSGNDGPRMVATAAGLLNGVGLQNPGVDAVIERYVGTWAGWRTPVLLSVAGGTIAEYEEVVRRLDGVVGVAGLELNLSCPNAARGGLLFGLDVDAAEALTTRVRRATDLPLLVKLAPGVTDVRSIARAVVDAGADAISAINTVPAFVPSADRAGPGLGSVYGGLSGPAIRPIALRVVVEVASAVDVPIVGLGGITGLDDVLDFLAAGASAVGIATAALADPALPGRLAVLLAEACRRRGLMSLQPLIGTARPRRGRGTSTTGAEYRP